MISLALLCLVIGLLLSALFSGTETGFYRVARLRLEVAAVAGDWIAQGILWLLVRPALFVATALVGNNLANYLISFGVVVLAESLTDVRNGLVEILATLVMAPVVFVLGELLPKRLFLQAPFTLLRYTGPLFFLFAIFLAPISVVLWMWNRLLALIVSTPPELARSAIAGAELGHILEEGEHAGLLTDIQTRLAEIILQEGGRPITHWSRPLGILPSAPLDAPPERNAELLNCGERFVLVTHPHEARHVVGYVDVVRWTLTPDRPLREVTRPLLRILAAERLVTVLRLMYQHGEKLAIVIDAKDYAQGIVWEKDLRQFYLGAATRYLQDAQIPAGS